MNSNIIPDGIWPVMITPIKQNGDVDYDALKKLIKWYEASGVHGFFANCLSSEMYELNRKERIELTEFVVKHSSIPVLSTGTFYDNTEENVDFIKELSDIGVDGVVLITSILAKEEDSDEVLLERIMEIVDHTTGIPLGLYECPVPYKRLLSSEAIGKLASTGRFVYMKDTSCNADVVVSKINAANGSNLKIFNAHTPDCLHSIRHDGAGISPIGANFYPELYTYLWNNGRGEILNEEVIRVKDFLVKNDGIVHHKYPVSAKYFLSLRGLPISEDTRKSIEKLEDEDKKQIENLYDNFLALSRNVGISEFAISE